MTGVISALEQRRTFYKIDKKLPVPEQTVIDRITKATELVPDAFNMRSQRVVIVLGEKQDQLWDAAYEAFGGKVPREKIDSFKAGAGTVLYFYDNEVISSIQKAVPAYAQNFPIWANQSNAMLQISVWSALRELGVGASLQHYNPVIDKPVKELLGIPESYVLVAEMPFGGIAGEPAEKEKEDISARVKVVK